MTKNNVVNGVLEIIRHRLQHKISRFGAGFTNPREGF